MISNADCTIFQQKLNIDTRKNEWIRTIINGVYLAEINGLHWWKFLSLFQGLNEDCNLCKIMGYRAIDINEVGKDQKEFYLKMKEPLSNPKHGHSAVSVGSKIYVIGGVNKLKI